MRLIDADALMNKRERVTSYDEGGWARELWAVDVDEIRNAETVETVKRGHWMPHTMRDGTPMERCDACGGLSQMMFDYCPNCGAWMYVRRG